MSDKATPLSFVFTSSAKLSELSVKDGQMIYVGDKGKIYFDLKGERTAYHDIIELPSDAERLALTTPATNKIYLILDNLEMWRHNGTAWVKLSSEPQVVFYEAEENGFPTEGNTNKLYVRGTDIYRYVSDSSAYVKMCQSRSSRWETI